jgi:hypothetical protein
MDAARANDEPTITAVLEDGPLAGQRREAAVVEGRPPKTIDLDGEGGETWRYVLSEWEQAGGSARYAFLYDV